MIRGGSIYILTNDNNTVFYIGVSSDLINRIAAHREERRSGFTKMYNCRKLVYFENYTRIEEAIDREKQLKNWKRQWKIDLISRDNPGFEDLYDRLE